MAKKGAAAATSKKAEQKQKQKIIEDKTFGLKNKNKSKKVQNQIKSIEKNVLNSGDPKQRKLEEQRQKAKAERKARAKALKDEQNALFGEALLAVQKKSNLDTKFGKVEAKGRDADDGANKKSTSNAMKMMYQMDAQEMEDKLKEDPNYVPTLEDKIESERQKKVTEMKAKGKGTPVTPETFAAWQERKRARRQAEIKSRVESEFKKKKGGKGLSVLTGREMYDYKRSLFDKVDEDEDGQDGESINDDDGGGDDNNENNENGGNNNSNSNANSNGNSKDNGEINGNTPSVEKVAEQVQSDLFLDGGDVDDLDDLDDD